MNVTLALVTALFASSQTPEEGITPSADPNRARDDAWVTQIRAGDDHAFELLFRAYVEPLTRYCASYLNDAEAAREIVSDMFLALWQRRQAWEHEQSVAAYLYTAVRNRSFNHVRASRRRAHWTAVAAREPEVAGFTGQTTHEPDAAEQSELLARIRLAVSELPASRREAMVLRWEHQLTPEQIASVMGVSRSAVYHLLERSLQTLRQILGLQE